MRGFRVRASSALDIPLLMTYLLLYIAIPVSHAITTILAWYITDSWVAAVATFFTPFAAEIYWAGVTWHHTGEFLNIFVAMYLGIGLVYCLSGLLTFVSMSSSPEDVEAMMD